MTLILLCILAATGFCVAPLPPRASFKKFLRPEESFQFSVDCTNVTNAQCNETKGGLGMIGNLIAQDILIKVPIKVSVSFINDTNVPEGERIQYEGFIQPPVGISMFTSGTKSNFQLFGTYFIVSTSTLQAAIRRVSDSSGRRCNNCLFLPTSRYSIEIWNSVGKQYWSFSM